jgi:hypothetical protein
VIIGPVHGNYYHKHIVEDRAVPSAKVLGGGYVDFTGRIGDKGLSWSARFHDSSGDYGVFDPGILKSEDRTAIATSLGMFLRFEWSGTARSR